MDFRQEIRRIALGLSPILEIGPSYNPILPKKDGYSVRTVDHASQSDLIKKYSDFGVDVSKIEPVDYITTDIGSLSANNIKYKIILASHVIEHTTDIIQFINDCSKLLDDNGKLILLVPDKRYCFDTYRPLSTAGSAIDAHLSGRSKHQGAVFDHYAFFTLRDGAMAWGEGSSGTESLIHSAAESVEALHGSIKKIEYVDAHEWVFTPKSFEMTIQDLSDCKMIDLCVETQHDTLGYEFFTILSRKKQEVRLARADYLHAIRREELAISLQSISSSEVIGLLDATHPELKLVSLIDQAKEVSIHNQQLKSEIRDLSINLEQLHRSTSWKITAPIRKVKYMLSLFLGRA